MSLLDGLAKKYGTDKSSETHNYCNKYEKYLPFNRYDNLNILEIGVLNGSSIATWKEFFYNSNIVGIDIEPKSKQYENIENNIFIEIGSQVDEDFLLKTASKYKQFDMILDDGSHLNEHVPFTFERLFPYVKSQGVYIIEDCGTSYWDFYGGGRYKKGTIMEYFKGITDEVNFFGEWQEDIKDIHARREDLLIKQFERKGYNYIGTQIESINFLNGIIIITKR
jgi:hypothetical protein